MTTTIATYSSFIAQHPDATAEDVVRCQSCDDGICQRTETGWECLSCGQQHSHEPVGDDIIIRPIVSVKPWSRQARDKMLAESPSFQATTAEARRDVAGIMHLATGSHSDTSYLDPANHTHIVIEEG